MDARAIQRMIQGATGSNQTPGVDQPLNDTSEQVHISALALLKMLKHGRAGVPLEVMGLMLGEFVDDWTVRVVDVFAMPQSGTGVSVEAVDPVFQTKMMDMPEMVVGCVDTNTQQSFEQLTPRAVAVVVDPIQSVRGKVVIDAFRLIPPQTIMMGQEPRQSTSNIGHLNKPSIQALIHGLNRHYYSIAINYRKTELEQAMFDMLSLASSYNKSVQEESTLTPEQLKTRHVGKQDPKRHLEEKVESAMADQISQALGTMMMALSA
ncbi:JAB1/Mov34/MPN/PAD-1 ubiquitin protease-domain-containing protein [Melampsora americana]|nr:JAB1/Mov34/MPN/PAD-1 ubiquitin protease-domain-containing protein [Melampsora americana]